MRIYLEVDVFANFFFLAPQNIRSMDVYSRASLDYSANLNYGIYLQGILFVIPPFYQKEILWPLCFLEWGSFNCCFHIV